MSKLRQTAAGGGKLLSLLSQTIKSRGKIATSAPLAPTANHNFAAPAVAFGLFALAITPFILATPVYAIDDNDDNDNHVEITVSDTTQFERQGQLFKATANVTVKTVKPYGFNLTLQASNSDLTNISDPTTKIASTPVTTPMALNSDQWGYSLSPKATTFSRVPNLTQPAAVLADVTKAKPAGCQDVKQCAKHVTYAANVDTRILTPGEYSTEVVYTATAKPKPAFTDWEQRTAKVNPSDVCRSGDNNSSCLVDLDKNMIPVKYTGTTTNAQWTSISNPEDEDAKGNWYNYGKKQWANAVTVKKEALAKYQGQDRVVDQADILGFWVYIPRYTYEVMRRDGTDKPVKEQNFDIKFENINTPKKRPLACKTGNGKDYRTECNVSRELPLMGGEVSTWTTHPAFSFGKKELNGIWFAKFETTGTTAQPTVLPNEFHISGSYSGMYYEVGNFYSLSKTLGINDPNDVGGSGFTTTQNNHHLAKLSSRMVNNNDWGAATYLSASKYGAGYDKVQINSSAIERIDYSSSYSITGCGPWENGNTDSYGNSNDFWIKHKGISIGGLGTQQACSADNSQRAYNGTLGQLASTTNNSTGIYDMSGGGWEYTVSSYTSDLNSSNTMNFSQSAHPPYVNNYNFTNPNSCTFATCGGQALYETNNGADNSDTSQWNGNYMCFITSSDPWFERGGDYGYGSRAGLFHAYCSSGYAYNHIGDYASAFRVALAPAPHD